MQSSRIQFLQDSPIFGGVKDDVLSFLLEHCKEIHVKTGEFFFREGEKAESMFVLESGRVAAYRNWEGEDFLLRKMDQSDFFGEIALIDLSPRSASVKALEACTALEISAQNFFELYQYNIEQFTLIYMNISRELSRRLRQSDQRLFQLMMLQKHPHSPPAMSSA